MSSPAKSSLPIDRDSVEQLKEKLLKLEVEEENNELSDNGTDEGIDDNDGLSTFQDVVILLDGMGMKQYIPIFKEENIDLNTFLSLTERDLIELGIVDKKDRNTLIKSIGAQKGPSVEYVVNENHTDDYQIVKNVQTHMSLMLNYCNYLECQMKKKKFYDYYITPNETALTFFDAFAKTAVKQTEMIRDIIHKEDSSNHLIGKLLKPDNLALPEDLNEKLIIKKTKKRSNRLVGLVGLSVVLVLAFSAKKLLEKVH